MSGQFAFALLDERRSEPLLAVDRCATPPMFYQMAGRSLLFASNGEALATHPGALVLVRRLPEDPAAHGQTVWQLMMLEQWLARGRGDGLAKKKCKPARASWRRSKRVKTVARARGAPVV